MKSKSSKNKPQIKNTVKCEFCKKEFSDEDFLIRHSCEKKRRWIERDLKVNRIGFSAFQKFYKMSYPKKEEKNYMDFINSRYYTSFVNFGRNILDLGRVEINQYIEYVIKNQIPLSDWSKFHIYKIFLIDKLLKESIDDAFIRSLGLIQEWLEISNMTFKDFYHNFPIGYIKESLIEGGLSPWILFIGEGHVILERMSSDDIQEIEFLLDQNKWKQKLLINRKRMIELESILGDIK